MRKRSDLMINRSEKLGQLKGDLRDILKRERSLGGAALERAADHLFSRSIDIVPVKSGELMQSIEVTVSKSPRYPGIIATATARNPRTGYDYALIQEENEDYEHEPPGQAHYLGEPFEEAVEMFLKETGYDK